MSAEPGKAQRDGVRRYDVETRERALELAHRHGSSEAARRTGIAAGTIRRWRHEAGRSESPDDAGPIEWAHRKREVANDTWSAARQALARVRNLLDAGGSRAERDAKDAALTLAILLDKSAALEQASALADERATRLAEAQAQMIADALFAVCDDLGLPRDNAIRGVVAHHVRGLSSEKVSSSPAPTSTAARAAIRDHVQDSGRQAESEQVKPQLAPPAGDSQRSSENCEESRGKRHPNRSKRTEERQSEAKTSEAANEKLDHEAERRMRWNEKAGPTRIGYRG